MKIRETFENCIFSSNFEEINNLLTKAQGSVSFWGNRVLTIAGYEGTLSVNALAQKVLRLTNLRSDADDLTTEERVAGIEITNKLIKLYQDTDVQISNANWFTKLLNIFREFSFSPYGTRFYTEETLKEKFCGYSEDAFIHHFGGAKSIDGVYLNSNGSFGLPLRITVDENLIRAKLAHV